MEQPFCREEAGRLLTAMGAEVKMFNPSGMPQWWIW